MAKKPQGAIELQRLQDFVVEIAIKGLTPIIPHQWSEKAKAMMPGHPEGTQVKTKKGKRKPVEEAEACVYRLEDGRPGMPATAFKSAIVSACRFFDKPSMVEAKTMIFVEGVGVKDQLVAIEGDPVLREDTPRLPNGNADLRYRYAFHDWSATLRIRFISSTLTADSIVSLVDAAGRCGVGDWRPSSPKSATGTYGTWRVDPSVEAKVTEQ